MSWQAGTLIGPYRLEERVGLGSAGEVWRADRDGRTVALKLYRGPLARTVRQEGELLRSLEHPHIARVLDWRPDAEPPYIALEYVGGGDLREYLCAGGMPVRDVVRILLQVCEALAYAHGRNAVHGDLKPANILVAADGRVVLADFGLGTETGSDKLELSLEDVSVPGTPAYISPERREGAPPHPSDDMYALGVVLYEMLTGTRPSGLRPPSHTRKDLPPALDALVVALLDKRDERPSAATVLARRKPLVRLPRPSLIAVAVVAALAAFASLPFVRFVPGRIRMLLPPLVGSIAAVTYWWRGRLG